MFPCNGVVYIDGNEAAVMDTPTNDSASADLLQWLKENYPNTQVKAVIINHFHEDCLGGLSTFHNAGIPSYAYEKTQRMARKKKHELPQNTFNDVLTLKIGDTTIQCRYLGAAHTSDNIVTWIPKHKALFGGCMIKSIGADKGNIADANLKQWPRTVQKVKDAYKPTLVIPGHGAAGGPELLDYTIEVFSRRN